MKAIILAAGMGARLGKNIPKTLIKLSNCKSILQMQVENLTKYLRIEDIYVVVGYKKELIMDEAPDLAFVYNSNYANTNTAKSLEIALRKFPDEDILWLNGDVVFDSKIIGKLLSSGRSCMAVNKANVGDEEVKYKTNKKGRIIEVSKVVDNGEGEALGINLILANDVKKLIYGLKICGLNDYFERAIELAFERGFSIYAVDIAPFFCVEVDFQEDLVKANEILKKINKSRNYR